MEKASVSSSEIESSNSGLASVVLRDAVSDQAMHQVEVAGGPSWYALACQLPGDLLKQVLAYSGVSPFCKGWRNAFEGIAADPQLQATWLTSHHPTINEALVRAAGYGSAGTVQLLLDRGADVRASSKDGRSTALRMTAAMGQMQTLRLLMDTGAEVSADGEGVLTMAARNGHADVARLLLACGVSEYSRNRVVILEAMQDHVASVRLLLDVVKDSLVEVIPFAMTAAAGEGRKDMVCYLLSCNHEATKRASGSGSAGWQSEMLGSFGPIALRLAATRGHEGMARLLMDRGADAVEALAQADMPLPVVQEALDFLPKLRAELKCAALP